MFNKSLFAAFATTAVMGFVGPLAKGRQRLSSVNAVGERFTIALNAHVYLD